MQFMARINDSAQILSSAFDLSANSKFPNEQTNTFLHCPQLCLLQLLENSRFVPVRFFAIWNILIPWYCRWKRIPAIVSRSEGECHRIVKVDGNNQIRIDFQEIFDWKFYQSTDTTPECWLENDRCKLVHLTYGMDYFVDSMHEGVQACQCEN